MGPTWGRQDPGGPHVGPMNLAIWEAFSTYAQQSINTAKLEEDPTTKEGMLTAGRSQIFLTEMVPQVVLSIPGFFSGLQW